MLSAILHGKKTGTGFAGVRLKIGETQGAEDVLTASVFERIAYLPDEIFIQFIKNLICQDDNIKELAEIEFWTTWTLNHGSRVEPDVVLKMNNGQTIIVEAKRYDFWQQQYRGQLANQIIAAYDNDIINPIVLTVGGLNDYTVKTRQILQDGINNAIVEKTDLKLEYQLYSVSWQQIYLALEQAIQIHNGQYLQRMLSDIRQAYDWHGIRYQPYRWLEELTPQSIAHTQLPTIFKHKNSWTALQPVGLIHQHFPSFLGR